jgi:hypothetical protein
MERGEKRNEGRLKQDERESRKREIRKRNRKMSRRLIHDQMIKFVRNSMTMEQIECEVQSKRIKLEFF